MPVSVSLTVTPVAPAHGQTVTATYAVIGNDGTPAIPDETVGVLGPARVGDTDYMARTEIILPGRPAVPPLPESFDPPVVAGLTFVATGNPRVFTAQVPA